MEKLMDVLFKKRHFSWAPKFVTVLEKEQQLKWLAEKINGEVERSKSANTSDEHKKYGMYNHVHVHVHAPYLL